MTCSGQRFYDHYSTLESSIFYAVRKLFDNRVGEDFCGNTLHLGFGGIFVQAAIEHQLKKFSLAHAVNALVAHLPERALNGLSLGIKHSSLEHDCDVGFHWV